MLYPFKLLIALGLCAALLACGPVAQAPAQLQSQALQPQLIRPLSQALDSALLAAQQATTPEQARSLAQQAFMRELSQLLQRQLSDKDVQLQVQTQWTANGQIQVQLQAQISDQAITAQAQRQVQFSP